MQASTPAARPTPRGSVAARALPWLLLLYCGASLLHFVHNAQHITDYPNLPAWLSRLTVYAAWCATFLVGVCGFALYRRGHARSGLLLLTVYTTLGLGGFLHYGRAPMSAHTLAMNLSIWAEAITAALALAAVLWVAASRAAPRADVFFYGLYMDAGTLREQSVDPVNPRRACAEGQALRLGRRATLVAQPGARAWGVVYALTEAELERLYGAPGLEDYRRGSLAVRLLGDGTVTAACYTLSRPPAPDEVNAGYAARLQRVLAGLGFPTDGVPGP